MKHLLFIILVTCALGAKAQDFVYTPINPAFGGNPYSYSWLLSSAQSQNKIESKKTSSYSYDKDPLKRFEEDINRQILNKLSYQLVRKQFSEQSLEAGTYEMGSYVIEVTESSKGIDVSILDRSSGGTTVVTVPYF